VTIAAATPPIRARARDGTAGRTTAPSRPADRARRPTGASRVARATPGAPAIPGAATRGVVIRGVVIRGAAIRSDRADRVDPVVGAAAVGVVAGATTKVAVRGAGSVSAAGATASSAAAAAGPSG